MADKLGIRSNAFKDGGLIPKEFAVEGNDVSPDLNWDKIEGVKSWALIADDPDAPKGTYVHWVLFNLPGDKTSLPKGASGNKDLLGGAIEGINSAGTKGYTGPNPPSGEHRYFFKLYGLDSKLDLGEDATKEDLLSKIEQLNTLAEGQLMGRYSVGGGEAARGTAT